MSTGYTLSFDDILTGIRSRQNSKAHEAAIAELERLAKRADELLAPERARQQAELEAQGKIDCSPDWSYILGHYIHGIRNANRRNPQDLVDRMTNSLRRMVAFARGELAGGER